MIKKNIESIKENIWDAFKNRIAVVAGGKEGSALSFISTGYFKKVDNKHLVFIGVAKEDKICKILNQNERFTLSFLEDYKQDEFQKIYDIDANLFYLNQSKYVFKLKKIEKINVGDNLDKDLVFYGGEISSCLESEDKFS